METNVQAGATETPEQFIERRDKAISTWLDRKGALDSIKPQELEARNGVSAILFPEPKKGTNRYHLNGGYAIKLVHATNYTLGDKDKIYPDTHPNVGEKIPIEDQVKENLARIHGLGNRGPELALALVKWKPELSETAYLALNLEDETDMKAKAIIDEILTTKPASPQLTFEPPK